MVISPPVTSLQPKVNYFRIKWTSLAQTYFISASSRNWRALSRQRWFFSREQGLIELVISLNFGRYKATSRMNTRLLFRLSFISVALLFPLQFWMRKHGLPANLLTLISPYWRSSPAKPQLGMFPTLTWAKSPPLLSFDIRAIAV